MEEVNIWPSKNSLIQSLSTIFINMWSSYETNFLWDSFRESFRSLGSSLSSSFYHLETEY